MVSSVYLGDYAEIDPVYRFVSAVYSGIRAIRISVVRTGVSLYYQLFGVFPSFTGDAQLLALP